MSVVLFVSLAVLAIGMKRDNHLCNMAASLLYDLTTIVCLLSLRTGGKSLAIYELHRHCLRWRKLSMQTIAWGMESLGPQVFISRRSTHWLPIGPIRQPRRAAMHSQHCLMPAGVHKYKLFEDLQHSGSFRDYKVHVFFSDIFAPLWPFSTNPMTLSALGHT